MSIQPKPHCYPIPMSEVVACVYTCLEMLRTEREDLHAWWCNLLYTHNGDIHYPSWNAMTLLAMENDCIFYLSHD